MDIVFCVLKFNFLLFSPLTLENTVRMTFYDVHGYPVVLHSDSLRQLMAAEKNITAMGKKINSKFILHVFGDLSLQYKIPIIRLGSKGL